MAVIGKTTFESNAAEYWGGGVLMYDESGLLVEGRAFFLSNVANTSNVDGSVKGGGICALRGSIVTVGGDSTFETNKTGSGGGAMYLKESHATLIGDATFESNAPENGGRTILMYDEAERSYWRIQRLFWKGAQTFWTTTPNDSLEERYVWTIRT